MNPKYHVGDVVKFKIPSGWKIRKIDFIIGGEDYFYYGFHDCFRNRKEEELTLISSSTEI